MLKKFEDQSKMEDEQHRQRVFVVHGRNEELRKSMFDFLRSIGLRPIEWSQAIQMTGETAPFVGDILDAAFLHAQAVVVLLTGDDEARLRPEYHSPKMPDHEKNLTPQARPNVLFEAGLALGRFPKQTVIVEVGDLRPFSDIAGRHTIRLNNSTKTRQDVAQRLAIAGCSVDLSGTDWHQAGNFDPQNLVTFPLKSTEENTNDTSDLHENAIRILLSLANIPDRYVDYLARDLSLPEGLVKHFLQDLEKRGFTIKSTSGFSSITKASITDEGFAYLVSRGKI